MFGAFEGLDDEAEEHAVDFVAEGPDGDVAVVEAGESVEPLLQLLLRRVDGGPVVVVGSGALDAGVEVVAGGVEGVQDGVPVFVRLPVVGVRVALGEGGDDGAEELSAVPVADGVGAVVRFVADGDDFGDCHGGRVAIRPDRASALRMTLLTEVLTPSLDTSGRLQKMIIYEIALSRSF